MTDNESETIFKVNQITCEIKSNQSMEMQNGPLICFLMINGQIFKFGMLTLSAKTLGAKRLLANYIKQKQ